jgi:hypothetical protein
MRAFTVAALAATLFISAARCETDEPESQKISISDVSFKEGKLWLEFENDGDTDVILLNRLDPEYGVIKIVARNEKDEVIKLGDKHKDWISGPDDRLRLRGKYRVTRPVALDLPGGLYTITVTYEVKKDSSFMDAWFMRKQDKRENESKKVMTEYYFGTLTSKEFKIQIPRETKTAVKLSDKLDKLDKR